MTRTRKRFERNRMFLAAICLAVIFKMDKMSVPELVRAAWKLMRSITARKRHKVDRWLYYRRMRHCSRCPLWVPSLMTCGSPIVTGGSGCGCYLPNKNALPEARCWLNEKTDMPGGWPKELEIVAT